MKAEWTNADSLTSGETTKAIIVIDKPESCTSCLLGIYNKRWFCLKTLKDIDLVDRYHIPDWCPLRPMPEKKPNERFWLDDEFNGGYRFGWNDCIDAIAGETE